jgi:transposase
MSLKDKDDIQITKNEVVIRKYGLLEPADWSDDCESEMRLIDVFWNRLIDIHEGYTTRYLMQIAGDHEFAEAKLQYDEVASRIASSPAVAASKKQLAIAQKNATRRMAVELRELEASRREDVKAARQSSGLWWSNYNAVVRSFERARNAAIRGGNTMRRRSEGKSGRITNTLQGGADVEALFDGGLSQVMVRPPTGRAWTAESRGERRRLQRTTLSATVFVRDGDRRTVTWPMIMHRPIPPDCRVKEVIITRRQVDGRWKWAVSFMCSRATEPTPSLAVSTRVVGVDIGWRRVPDGLRVATIVASGEPPRFVNLPRDLLDSFGLIDDLRTRVRAITLRGLDLLQSADASRYDPPFQDLLREFQAIPDKRTLHLKEFSQSPFFLSQRREAIGAEMLAWRREYKKFTAWLVNQQRKVVARRNHLYQNVAIDVLSNASEVIINDVRLGEIAARKPLSLDGAFFPNRANYYRVTAAPSEMISALKLQAAKRGVSFAKREAESPVRCPECGSTSRKTRADALPQICAKCDTSFDQDVAACQSLLEPVRPTYRATRTVSFEGG